MLRRAMLLALLIVSIGSFAQIRLERRGNEARNTVQSYCRLDYDGARLTKDGWTRLRPLSMWKQNPDWQGFTVVSQYEIIAAEQGLRGATVAVKYPVLGSFIVGEGYTSEPATEVTTFRLKETDDAWRIDSIEPNMRPHVSKLRALTWLKGAASSEQDPGRNAALQQAIKALGENTSTDSH
ncbi:MAG: hypothetical protein ACR2IF_14775 [Terriglobales bacterium]